MKHNISLFTAACSLFLLLGTACSESAVQSPEAEPADVMTFQVNHPWTPAPTRVTETAFESGDQVGLYITDTQTLLEPGGNYVNNAPSVMITPNGLPRSLFIGIRVPTMYMLIIPMQPPLYLPAIIRSQ